MKVLIAEDDAVSRKILITRLERWGYEVGAVADGEAAWEVLTGPDCPPMALLDWEMPGINGDELCRRIRARAGKENLYLILLTGRTRTDDVVEGLEAGADDYLTKPVQKSELKARLNVGRRTVELRALLLEQFEKVSEANARLERSLEAAATVQKSLLPTILPEVLGYSFAWRYLPSELLGGDMLNIFSCDGAIICYALDVSGHGVPSALLSVTVRNQIGQSGLGGGAVPLDEPALVMNQLSRHFAGMLVRTEQYFTMIYGVLRPETGEFRFVQAGHPFPVVRSGERAFEVEGPSHLPMGVVETTYSELSVTLKPGDDLYLYTDGITETCPAEGGELFGAEGMIRALLAAAPGEEALDRIVRESLEWGSVDVFGDDATAIRISRH